MRFRAYGWDVVELGEMADDLDGLEAALLAAKAQTDKPSLLMLRSHIGEPSPDHVDTHGAHGNPFSPDDVARTKAVMGIPDEPFWAPDDLVAAYRTTSGSEVPPPEPTGRSATPTSPPIRSGRRPGRAPAPAGGMPICPRTSSVSRSRPARRSRRPSTPPTTASPD